MARSAWTFALVSFGFSGLLAGCVVTSGDGGGGVGNFGGSDTGGQATGGSAGAATGGTGNSGGAATGGSAGTAPTVACDPGVSNPVPTCDTTQSDACLACLADKCCVPYAACFGTNPTDRCTNEFTCMRACMANPAQYACDTSVDPDAIQLCCAGSACAEPSCGDTFVGDNTSALLTCINDDQNLKPCSSECGFL